jgi:hypothetical protein
VPASTASALVTSRSEIRYCGWPFALSVSKVNTTSSAAIRLPSEKRA